MYYQIAVVTHSIPITISGTEPNSTLIKYTYNVYCSRW
jgi:hypothetical protein